MPRFIDQVRAIPGELQHLPRSIKRVSLLMLVYYLGWGLVQPFMPLYFRDILGSYGGTTLVTALLYIFGALWMFPVGEFLDRFSKRRVIRWMLLLYVFLWPILASLRTLFHVVLYRVYHSFSSTGLWSAAETYTREKAPARHGSESMGLFDAGTMFSLVVGGIAGGLLLEHVFSIRELLVTLPPLFMIIAYLIGWTLPDGTHETRSVGAALRSIEWRKLYRKELFDFWSRPALRSLWPFIVFSGFLAHTQGILLPLLSEAVGASLLQIGLVYALFMAPLVLEAPFSVLADRWSRRGLLLIGGIVAVATLAGLFVSQRPTVLFPLALLLGTAIAMIKPTVSGATTDAIHHDHTGEMNAVYSATFGVGGVAGLLALGPLADSAGIHMPFLVSGIVMAVFMLIVLVRWGAVEAALDTG